MRPVAALLGAFGLGAVVATVAALSIGWKLGLATQQVRADEQARLATMVRIAENALRPAPGQASTSVPGSSGGSLMEAPLPKPDPAVGLATAPAAATSAAAAVGSGSAASAARPQSSAPIVPRPGPISAPAKPPSTPSAVATRGPAAATVPAAVVAGAAAPAPGSAASVEAAGSSSVVAAASPAETASAPKQLPLEGVSYDKAGVARLEPRAVTLRDGRRIEVGQAFPSGETLVAVDAVNSRMVTSQRQILLFGSPPTAQR